MSNFDSSFQLLMKHEGGYVNNAQDAGGPTNMGITQGDLASWYNRPVSIDEVKNMSLEQAKGLYRIRFWEHMRLDAISNNKVATLIFDQGVVRGPGRIIQDIQHILKLDPDGIMGPDTIEAINTQNEKQFGIQLIKECQTAYAHLVVIKPTQSDFLIGWLTRTHSLLDYLLFSV